MKIDNYRAQFLRQGMRPRDEALEAIWAATTEKKMDPYFQVNPNDMWDEYLDTYQCQGKFAPEENTEGPGQPPKTAGDNGYIEDTYVSGDDIMDITRGMF